MAKTKRDDMPKTPGMVYLLHFDRPIGNPDKKRGQAQHYVGCTSALQDRMTGHAYGVTASIVRAVIDSGNEWQLAAVGVTHRRGMRKIERQVKNWKSARVFCPLCGGSGRLPGTTDYPLDLLSFPLRSDALREFVGRWPGVIVRPPTPDDGNVIEKVRELMDQEKESVGFVPASDGGTIGVALGAGRLLLGVAGRRVVGYLWWTENPERVKIQQTVVTSGFQGQGIGRTMVTNLLRARYRTPVVCEVRSELRAAAEFWPALGFSEYKREPHPSSGAEIVHFRNANGAQAEESPSIPANNTEEEFPW